jgi:hypothetical protein
MFSCFKNIIEAKRLLDIGGIKYIIISYEINDKDFKLIRKEDLGDKNVFLYEYKKLPGRFLLFNNIRK